MENTKPKEITHRIRWVVIQRLLKPETLAEGNNRVSMEIRLLKLLEKMGYNDPDFWLKFNLGFQIRSIGWLKNDGRQQLSEAWARFQVYKKEKEELDKKKKESIMAKIREINDVNKNIVKPAPKKHIKKTTVIEWMDEKEL